MAERGTHEYARGRLAEPRVDIAYVALRDIADISEQVRDILERVRVLLVDVVRAEDVVHRAQCTRLVLVHVAHTQRARLLLRDGAQVDFREVDRAETAL